MCGIQEKEGWLRPCAPHYTNSKNVKLNKIRAERLINQKEAFSFTNRLQLTQTAMEIEKQKAIIRQDEEIVRLKGDIRKSYQLRFDNGMCSMNDLINSIAKENEALSNQALHQIQLLMSIYNYKTISGN